jgi:hypothetical protein
MKFKRLDWDERTALFSPGLQHRSKKRFVTSAGARGDRRQPVGKNLAPDIGLQEVHLRVRGKRRVHGAVG